MSRGAVKPSSVLPPIRHSSGYAVVALTPGVLRLDTWDEDNERVSTLLTPAQVRSLIIDLQRGLDDDRRFES